VEQPAEQDKDKISTFKSHFMLSYYYCCQLCTLL